MSEILLPTPLIVFVFGILSFYTLELQKSQLDTCHFMIQQKFIIVMHWRIIHENQWSKWFIMSLAFLFICTGIIAFFILHCSYEFCLENTFKFSYNRNISLIFVGKKILISLIDIPWPRMIFVVGFKSRYFLLLFFSFSIISSILSEGGADMSDLHQQQPPFIPKPPL